MGIQIDIDTEEILFFLKKKRFLAAVEKALDEAALVVLERATKSPRQSRGPMEFVSPQQRAFFFAALDSGEIEVPYQRQFVLQDLWDVSIGILTAVIFNEVEYAKWVHNNESQAQIHRGNWDTEDDIARKASRRALKAFQDGFDRAYSS